MSIRYEVAIMDTVVVSSLAPTQSGEAQVTINEPVVVNPTANPGQPPRLLVISLLIGALGGLLHAIRSFTQYAGAGKLVSSFLTWYLFRPIVGGFVSSVFYFIWRHNLDDDTVLHPMTALYTVATISALAGIFSEGAMEKLREAFVVILNAKTKGAADLTEPVEGKSKPLNRYTMLKEAVKSNVPLKDVSLSMLTSQLKRDGMDDEITRVTRYQQLHESMQSQDPTRVAVTRKLDKTIKKIV